MGNKGKPEHPPLSPNYAHAQNNLQEKFLKFLHVQNFGSVQNFGEFISIDHLSQPVQVLSSGLVILDTTRHGRLLIQMLMVALLDYHSKGISWDGTFDTTDMVVIDDGHAFKQLQILKNPMEADKCMERVHEAMAKDLHKVSELIIPLYKAQDGTMPVYFSQLKEDLDGVTSELVAKAWFGEYLRSHVALMPSTARRNLEIMLYATCENPGVGYIPVLLAKPTVYPIDWRRALMKLAKKDINGVEIDQYENSVCGLMRFKSNFLEQVGQGQVTEPELYAADMFREFLPTLVCTLLEQGFMKKVFGKAWKDFKELRSVKSDPYST